MKHREELRRIFRRAKKLLEDPDNWIQGRLSANRMNETCEIDHHTACRFCLMGAVVRAKIELGHRDVDAIRVLWDTSSEVNDHGAVYQFNDHPKTTHEDVLRVLDSAIVLTAP